MHLSTPPGMNPRDKRPGERRTLGVRGPARGAVWYVLGFLHADGAGAGVVPAAGGPADLLQRVQAGGTRRPGRRGHRRRADHPRHATSATSTAAATSTPTRIEDPKLLEELDAAGVKYTGEFVSRWLPEVIGWVMPLLLLFAHLELLLPAHERRRGRRHVLRAQQAPRVRRRRREGELRGRGGRGRGRAGAEGDRRVPEDARRSTPRSAAASPRACCSSARPAPARRCWRAPSPAKPRCPSSA